MLKAFVLWNIAGFLKMQISLTKQIRSPTMTRYASVTSAALATIAYIVLVESDKFVCPGFMFNLLWRFLFIF